MPIVPGKYRGRKEYYLVHCELIRAAQYRGLTTYQAIAELLGLPLTGSHMGVQVGRIVGQISEDEVQHGRPMLIAIVVGTSGLPGKGFFSLARQLGKLQEDSKDAEARFWEAEKAAVYETWRKEFKSSP